MRSLRSKLIILLLFGALIPLLVFGALSFYNARQALRKSFQENFVQITQRTTGQIQLYFENFETVFETLAEDIANTHLQPDQVQRIIENYVIRFPQFQKIIYFGPNRQIRHSTSLSKEDPDLPAKELIDSLRAKVNLFSKPYLSEELTPVLWYLLPISNAGTEGDILAVQVDLMQMWRWVGEGKFGKTGFVTVVDGEGEIIASGDPQLKRAILSNDHPIYFENWSQALRQRTPEVIEVGASRKMISSDPIGETPGWHLIVTQDADEVFSPLNRLGIELLGLIAFTLILMTTIAYFGSRKALLQPVRKLVVATRALGAGDLHYRVSGLSDDELGQLGNSFNQMAEDLVHYQETTKRQERFAMFGRIASSLAHDLKHPVKNIENAARLMESLYEDPEYREKFTRIVQREFSRINQFLDDLRNLTHEMPFHPQPFQLRNLLEEVVESFSDEAAKNQVRLVLDMPESVEGVVGDSALLRRVFENLLSNALQAMPEPGGEVRFRIRSLNADELEVRVEDTGSGIPADKLPGLFDEFMTTKGKGLGLGLAITRKILQMHRGNIGVTSEMGKGTSFNLRWNKQVG